MMGFKMSTAVGSVNTEVPEVQPGDYCKVRGNCATVEFWSVRCYQSDIVDIPHDYAKNTNHPAEYASKSFAELEIGLDHHKRDCSPKHDLKCVEYNIGLKTGPFFECLHMFR